MNKKINSNNTDVRALLYEIVENGNFPDESFGIEHIEKIDIKEWVSNDKVRFIVERHPHLFGHPSIGNASSAFARVEYIFELSVGAKTVKLIDENTLSNEIDYNALANEVVPDTVEGWLGDSASELANLKTEKEVIRFAEQGFKSIDWLACYEPYIEEDSFPNDFKDKLLKAFKKQFIDEILKEWKS